MARFPKVPAKKTLASVVAARQAASKVRDTKHSAQMTMVYLIEVRVPLENLDSFREEGEDGFDSLREYGSCSIIESGVVQGPE